MVSKTWKTGQVIRIVDETSNIRRFWVHVQEINKFEFIPGQFVTLDLPIHDNPGKRYRSYSIASWPDDTNVFELVIARDNYGIGSLYFFEEVKVGTTIKLAEPQGLFNLRLPLDNNVFMICTGTGIAPFRSMIHYIKNNNILHENIYLIFGSRTKNSLLYYDEMIKFQEMMPGFHYIPTLSREHWDGNTGYVHPIYESLCINRKPATFYLTGCKAMIEDAKKKIADMGYDIITIQ